MKFIVFSIFLFFSYFSYSYAESDDIDLCEGIYKEVKDNPQTVYTFQSYFLLQSLNGNIGCGFSITFIPLNFDNMPFELLEMFEIYEEKTIGYIYIEE